MRGPDLSFAYAQPRLQSRLAQRPDAVTWQRLQASGDLGLLLQASAPTPLADWTSRLRHDADVHEIEARLRGHWIEFVTRIAAWQPRRWRDALRWLRWLPWLSMLDALAQGTDVPRWLRTDPMLGPLASAGTGTRAAELEALGLTRLAPAFAGRGDLYDAYVAQWRITWPCNSASTRPALERVLRLAATQRSALAALPATASSDPVVRAFEQGLLATFRRHPLTPTAAVAFLWLAASDFVRLRGLVIERAVRAPVNVA
jgi:hypothetical protein